MRVKAGLVYMLLKMDPEKFKGYVVYEKGLKALSVVVLRAIYGMLVVSLIW